MQWQEELQFALKTVRTASEIVKQVQCEMVSGELTKGDRSPVTVGDYSAQAFVGQVLSEAYPNDPLVGEEDSALLAANESQLAQVTDFVKQYLSQATPERICQWVDYGNGDATDRFWTLDPIDGTKGFLRKAQYAVCLALIVEGEVVLGVLGCPELEEGRKEAIGGAGSLLYSVRGNGAHCLPLTDPSADPVQVQVSQTADFAAARMLRSAESSHTNTDQIDRFCEVLGVQGEPIGMDSQAKYAALATGAGDFAARFLSADRPNYREKIWDHASGSLIVTEAGGRITDLDGNPLDFSQGKQLEKNRGQLCSNGLLHDRLLDAIKEIGA